MSFDQITQDARYALRSLRRSPGYAALVISTLAFGIAANATVFSVMNPYLFRPLPFGSPDELVQVNQINPTTGWDMDRFSYPQYEDWKERSRAFRDVAAYSYGSANVTGAEGPEQIQFARLTTNMFEVLDAAPAMGRTFRSDEATPGSQPVVVMAHGLWVRRYAADPAVVGRVINLDGVQRTVVGVMPREFNFPFGGVKLWIPVQETRAGADRGSRAYQLVGRLAPGWTPERAHQELLTIQSELVAVHPDTDGRMSGVSVSGLREALNFAWDIIGILFYVLLGAVGFVLLIACANVASLTLARGSGRLREVSVRAALGARRGRIVRQLMTESLALALAGGALGIGITYVLTGLLNPVIPEDLFKIGAVSVDRAVLGFSLLVTLVTTVAFGLAPALSASRIDLSTGLKEGAKSAGGRGMSRGRQSLVVAQVTLAVVLITGAGLMLRSFSAVQSIDMGFDPEPVATVEIVLDVDAYPSAQERRTMVERAAAATAATPGVRASSAVHWLPLNHETMTNQVASSESSALPAEEWPLAVSNYVLPGYFETMSIELVAGRDFSALDAADAQPVAIVNRSLANRLWPDGSPLGRTLLLDPDEPREALVVGVVADVMHADLDPASVGPQLYRPSLQTSARRFFVVARSDVEVRDLVPRIRGALGAVAPDLPLTVRPMTDVVAESQIQWSLTSVFLAVFGAGALLLATLGIYGLIAYSVAQRRREIGVRVALGATGSEIRRGIVIDGVRLTAVGLGLGLIAALLLGRVASAMLYGVAAADPLTLSVVMSLFLGVAVLASFVPAARASRTHPNEVLRSE